MTPERRSQTTNRRIHRITSSACLALAVAVLPNGVSAQSVTTDADRSLSLERFRLATDRQGVLDVEGGRTSHQGDWNLSLWGNYANDPLVIRDSDSDTRLGSPIHHRVSGALAFAYALTDTFQIAASLPLVFWQSGEQNITGVTGLPNSNIGSTGIGNFRISPKVGLFQSDDHAFDLSLLAHVIIPGPQKSGYFGDRAFGVEPELAAASEVGGLRIAVNAGYHWRSSAPTLLTTTIHDEFTARAGVGYRFGEDKSRQDSRPGPFEIDLSIAGATAPRELFSARTQDAGTVAAAFQYDLPAPVTLFVSGGLGLFPAYGVPDFNVVFGARLWSGAAPVAAAPVVVDTDPDHDGVVAPNDRCPDRAEDKDGFEDEDGCPDPDNDGDGVIDADDGCPKEKGTAENKGCPDKDTDADGIVDRLDKCAGEAEDKDGFEDDDGCPDPDNDHDGIADAKDACPIEAGIAENKGCPDRDRDGDGIVDRMDNCPDEVGTKENSDCKAKQLARITSSGIEIMDTVYFKVDRDLIQSKSFPLLTNVANVIRNHPEAGVIRVEGHTDNQGKEDHNQSLSQRRAEAVVAYLVKSGVPRERLVARGYGASKPIADNHKAAGRAKNRRVAFVESDESASPAP